MKTRHLIGAALLALTLAAAGPATAATVTVNVEPLIRKQGGLGGGAPPIEDGGGYPGCWRAYVQAWDGHWTGFDVAPLLQPVLVRKRLRRHVRRPVLALPDDEWLLRPERRQPVACRRLHRLRRNPVPCPGALLVQLRRMDELLQRRPLHHALRLEWDSRPVTTTRVFLAVLAALIVFSALGAVLAIVATDDDEPATTRVETTSP